MRNKSIIVVGLLGLLLFSNFVNLTDAITTTRDESEIKVGKPDLIVSAVSAWWVKDPRTGNGLLSFHFTVRNIGAKYTGNGRMTTDIYIDGGWIYSTTQGLPTDITHKPATIATNLYIYSRKPNTVSAKITTTVEESNTNNNEKTSSVQSGLGIICTVYDNNIPVGDGQAQINCFSLQLYLACGAKYYSLRTNDDGQVCLPLPYTKIGFPYPFYIVKAIYQGKTITRLIIPNMLKTQFDFKF